MIIVPEIKSYKRLYADHFVYNSNAEVECINYPVNVEHVLWIQTDAKIPCINKTWKPAITFHFTHNQSVTWAGYECEEERDAVVEYIIGYMNTLKYGI